MADEGIRKRIGAYERVVDVVATSATRRVCRRVRLALQRQEAAQDQGLRNVWNEVCVQVNTGRSVIWELYEDLIQGLLEVEVEKLAGCELEALALQSDTGESWLDEAGGDESIPVFMPEIVDLMHSGLMGEAGNWSNPVLREHSG